ncbi:transporter substrate-binding domain-containing protein [Vibrio sp. SS-MA-C1-2]|nr:transporter substrate-binding domain-containing protein [Vibrio sp. SS-MA-C1-2]UJF17207.1 transporter substrate-binding domain-containing protein [Vibrio sp. SS-MA-C1-2]
MLTSLSGIAHGAVKPERLILATQLWSPYQVMNQQGELSGATVELTKCALRGMQQPYEIHVMSWDQAQLWVQTNKADGFFAGAANSQRATYATASEPIISEHLAWFISPNLHKDVTDETSKYILRYGAKFNTSKWIYLKRNNYNVIKKPRDADALLQMLWQGDIDVAYEYEMVFKDSMEKAGIPDNYFSKERIKKQELRAHFSNTFLAKHPTFLDNFNLSLKICKQHQ